MFYAIKHVKYVQSVKSNVALEKSLKVLGKWLQLFVWTLDKN